MFSKFGHCKFKESCKRNHYSKICKLNQACQTTKTCLKRHPKICKKDKTDKGCKFGSDCSYEHSTDQGTIEGCETKAKVALQEKVDLLENSVNELTRKVEDMKAEKFEPLDKVVRALVRKVLSLETELEELKSARKPRKGVEESVVSNKVKENCFTNEVSFHAHRGRIRSEPVAHGVRDKHHTLRTIRLIYPPQATCFL